MISGLSDPSVARLAPPNRRAGANSRELDQFEKWVLLTLVGVHLSDDIKKAGDIRGFTSTDVGDLLTLWTEGLEEADRPAENPLQERAGW